MSYVDSDNGDDKFCCGSVSFLVAIEYVTQKERVDDELRDGKINAGDKPYGNEAL